MMCYRKKELKNRILDSHRTGFDKHTIKAPCGCCPSCRTVRTNSWLVRAYYEFLDNDSQAFFVSLDFDDLHLPRWYGVPCFDSEIIKGFLKRLRYYIGSFRYFYSTDYGGFLHRPHYHMMILPTKRLENTIFFPAIHKSWTCGHYTDIEALPSVGDNKMKALSYICGYVTKDITFLTPSKEECPEKMPIRFRPRVQASKGFGALPLEDGRITPDMLLNDEKILINLGKDGSPKAFPIPRYYEMKIAFDRKYDSTTRKTELIKNSFGVALSKNRHNSHYSYYIRSFFASRFWGISTKDTFFDNVKWYDVVAQCLDNFEDFKEFVFYRPFIVSLTNYRIVDNIRNEVLVRPNWHIYQFACSIYDDKKKDIDKSTDLVKTDRLIHKAKYRAIKKLEHSPRLRRYLSSRNYDFSQLYN